MGLYQDWLRSMAAGFAVSILFGWFGASTASADYKAENEAIYAKASPSVVRIVVESANGKGWRGCGCIVDSSGVVLTNAHVINPRRFKDFRRCYIKFPADQDNREYVSEGFLDVLPTRDLALIRFKPGERKCKALRLAKNLPRPGETVFLSNQSRCDFPPIHSGAVSSIRTGREIEDTILEKLGQKDLYERQMGYSLDATWIQHTAAMSPGGCGAPLVNARGEVIGLSTWHLASGENMNFAVSALSITQFLASASKTVKPWNQLPRWKWAGEGEEEPQGDAGATLASWKKLNIAKIKLVDRINSVGAKLARVPPLDPHSAGEVQDDRNKKLSAVYKKYADAYRAYAAETRAANRELAEPMLVKFIVADAEAHDQTGAIYQQCATCNIKRGENRQIDSNAIAIKKRLLSEIRIQHDILRVKLNRLYDVGFPTLDDTMAKSNKAMGQNANDPPGFRLWTSSNTQFHLRAKCVGTEGEFVKLETLSGKVIKVRLSNLSEVDRRFIAERSDKPKPAS